MGGIFNRRRFVLVCTLALTLGGFVRSSLAAGEKEAAAPPKGQRVLISGHSFHYFVAAPLAKVAEAGGIKDHVNAGTQSIGGSTVTQHWELADDKNKVKKALKEGSIDVLTMSPHMKLVPDKAITDFAEMGFAKNPNLRVLVQESWEAYDDWFHQIKANADRDQKTVDQLRPPLEEFRKGLEKQAKEINDKLGKPVVSVVPVGDAVLALRAKVITGEVPGIAKQSDLFVDAIGHGKEPIQRLEAYVYFATIYHKSPVGLTVFEKPGDADSQKLNRLLQEIAWKTVSAYETGGAKASR
jgi:hypothetical protein